MAVSIIYGNRHVSFEFFAALFLHHGSTLKEMDDDRNHRE
jgi:hypothetical protein